VHRLNALDVKTDLGADPPLSSFLFGLWTIDGAEETKRRRKSRWAAEEEKVVIPGMPTALPSNMTSDQLEMFLCKSLLPYSSQSMVFSMMFPLLLLLRTHC
jgi:hypothetical protein